MVIFDETNVFIIKDKQIGMHDIKKNHTDLYMFDLTRSVYKHIDQLQKEY